MRLRRSRRAAGPAAAHDSRFGPRDAPRITSIQRDAVHRQILDRLGNAGDLSILVQHNDLGAARRLAREVSDDVQLIDALGWDESRGAGDVELALPSGQLRRTFARLLEGAVEQREESSPVPAETRSPYEQALIVIEASNQVLALVGDAEATGD